MKKRLYTFTIGLVLVTYFISILLIIKSIFFGIPTWQTFAAVFWSSMITGIASQIKDN